MIQRWAWGGGGGLVEMVKKLRLQMEVTSSNPGKRGKTAAYQSDGSMASFSLFINVNNLIYE